MAINHRFLGASGLPQNPVLARTGPSPGLDGAEMDRLTIPTIGRPPCRVAVSGLDFVAVEHGRPVAGVGEPLRKSFFSNNLHRWRRSSVG